MKDIARNLRKTVDFVLPFLQNYSGIEASKKSTPEQWSKKEILGHLIDSACNDHQKLIRTMAEKHVEFPDYQQNSWVESQNYNSATWKNLVTLWHAYNLHLLHVIDGVKTADLSNTISIGDSESVTLEFVMQDYVVHVKHHLSQILPNLNLESAFTNHEKKLK